MLGAPLSHEKLVLAFGGGIGIVGLLTAKGSARTDITQIEEKGKARAAPVTR
jgi:hypothetical protein